MTTWTFSRLVIERRESDDGHVYVLKGLPQGKDFRKETSYVSIMCQSYMHVNGVGFSTEACEFSQHGHVIEVTQEHSNGSVKINFKEE